MEKISEEICAYPIYAKTILLEHDYSGNFHNNNNNSANSSKENATVKKCRGTFDAVDKWADSVILRVSTGDDRKKIVDREITILRVKYPFLPEQQIRGKVYEKFGIPAVMGGVVSRGVSLLAASAPKDHRPKSRPTRDPRRTTMNTRKSIVSQEPTNNNDDKWYLAEPLNQPYFSKINENLNNDEIDPVEIYEDALGQPINSDHNRYAADARNFEKLSSPPLRDKSPMIREHEKKLPPDSKFSNSPQLVSPLRLDDLSMNREYDSCLVSRNSRRIRSSIARRRVSTNFQVERILDLVPTSTDCQTRDTAAREKVSINSQQTQIVAKPRQIQNSRTFVTNDLSVISKVPTTTTKSKSSSQKPEIRGDAKLENITTQIYESPSRKNTHNRRDTIMEKPKGGKQKMNEKSCAKIKDVEFVDKLCNIDESPPYEIIELSSSTVDNSSISIGTFIEAPAILSAKMPNHDIVTLEHSYSGDRISSSSPPLFFTRETQDSEDDEVDEIKFVKNVTTGDTKDALENKKTGSVAKIEKQNSENKENNIPAKSSRHEGKRGRKRLLDEYLSVNENINLSPVDASSTRKKRRLCGTINLDISANRGIAKKNDVRTNFSPNEESDNRKITKSAVNILDDLDVKILPANFIPWRDDMPLFVVVDSLSNHCCEYEHDLEKISRLCDYANTFDSEDKSLKDALIINVEESEIREEIDEALKFLENDCRNV